MVSRDAPPSRARRPSALRSLVCALGLVGLGLPASGATGCGRIGYDAQPEDGGPHPADASLDRDGVRDAFAGGIVGASMADATLEASVDAPALDAPDDAGSAEASDAPADASCAVSAIVDYCAALPPLPAPPIIDGVLDCGPALVPMTPVDWSGPPPLPSFPTGNSAALAAAWRPDGLYVFMDVTMPGAFPADLANPVFYGAGVEIFVDDDATSASPPSYDNPGAIQLIVTAPPDASTTSRRAEGFRNAADEGPWASTQFGAFPSATGFVFEGFVVAADLGLSTWELAAGRQVGFDVSVDVSFPTAAMTGPQGHRVGQYFLHVGATPPDASVATTPFQDPRAFCAPALAPM